MISPEILRRHAFFVLGGEDALKAIAMMANEVNLKKGEVLFDDGDDAHLLFVVHGGEVNVLQVLGDKADVVVDSVVAGELLGWSALSDHRVRRSKCMAARDSRLIAIDAPALRELMSENPNLGYHVMRAVAATVERRLHGAWIQLAADKTPGK